MPGKLYQTLLYVNYIMRDSVDGSVLVEFDYPQADPKSRLSQARVKSNQAEIESGSYKVIVELEVAQTARVVPKQVEPQTVIKKPALQPVPVSTAAKAESEGGPVIALRELASVPQSTAIPQPLPRPKHEGSPTIDLESREPLPRTQAENPIAVREAVKSAVAAEIKQEITLLRSWISSELERSLPPIVSSKMEKMIGDSLEKQISVNYEASIQALNADVACQVGDRIAESKDLRTSLEGMAKKLFEEQAELSRTAGAKVEQELSTRAATIIRSFEESVAEMGARINTARADMEVVLTKSQTLQQEINDGMLSLRKALEQLNNAETAGREKFQSQVDSQLNTFATQFENQLNKTSIEKTVQFSMEMEKQQAHHQQCADETVEKLGAMLQLLQGTARVQQERLTEHSRTTLANLEKEIRALLLRLAGGA
jgi:hypothetical protein